MSQIDIVPAYFPTCRQLIARALIVNRSLVEEKLDEDLAALPEHGHGRYRTGWRLGSWLGQIEKTTGVSRDDATALYGVAAKLVRAMTGRYVNGLEPRASRGLPVNLCKLADDSIVGMLAWIMREYMVEERNSWFYGFEVQLNSDTVTLVMDMQCEPTLVRELTWEGRFVHVLKAPQ